MRRNSLMAILLAILVILPVVSLSGIVSAFVSGGNSVPGDTDFIVVYGTAYKDRYDPWQYTYKIYRWAGETPEEALEEAKIKLIQDGKFGTLRLGFTEYGEMIVVNDTIRAGLAYGTADDEFDTTESLACTNVDPKEMFSGWVLFIRYVRNIGPANITKTNVREVLAWAVSGDWVTAGAGRGVLAKWAEDTDGKPIYWSYDYAVQEGRLEPHGIKVLYESARLVVFRINVSVYDNIDLNGDDIPDQTDPVADVVFTVIFNKVKKYAIILKDIKIKLNPQQVQTIEAFAFSNREKLDIAGAINSKLNSYVHYYHNFAESVYQYPILHWNKTDVLVAYNDADPDQFKPTDPQYVVFKFFWPNATEYTVYNPNEMSPSPTGLTPEDSKDGVLPPETAVSDIPYPPGEPSVPFVIVQWYFRRGVDPKINALLDALRDGSSVRDPTKPDVPVPISQQVRFVEVIGMTSKYCSCSYELGKCPLVCEETISPEMANKINWEEQEALKLVKDTWDANDNITAPGDFNSPGIEVLYFWDEVFEPLDLNDVDQHTFKWISLGFYAPPEDTAGSAALTGPHFFPISQPMIIMDRYDPRTRRSMPYALYTYDGFVNDTVDGFYRVIGLMDFVFGVYDDVQAQPKQPIAGGFSADWIVDVNETHHWVCRYFYPSINQLYERLVWCDLVGKVQGTIYEQKVFRYPNTNYSVTGLINVAGPKANQVTRYFNDFAFAIVREGTDPYALIDGGTVTGTAPTSNPDLPSLDIFPLTTWNVGLVTGVGPDHFIVTITRDINGTLGYNIWGWNARDSFWGAIWASYFLGHFGGWLPEGVVALIVHITYTSDYREPESFEIIYALGTITEFKLAYEFAFGKGKGLPPLPPSPPLPDLDEINAVNEDTYDWRTVGLKTYIKYFETDGGEIVRKVIIGYPWWGEKLTTTDLTEIHCDP